MITAKPTREFRRHHDVDEPRVDHRAFRQGWRIRTRLDQLLADDRITRGEWQAASAYRDAWASAREITRADEPGMISSPGAGSPDAAMIAKLDAVEKLRRVEDAIGPFAASLVRCCVVHDMTWAATARYCQRNPETIRDWTVFAIRSLAGAWAGLGRRDGGARASGRQRRRTAVRAS